jgi:hypothetical protein
MEFITAYIFCSLLSVSTISLIWVHRQQLREIMENDSPNEEELSSHDSSDTLITSNSINPFKTQNCFKRVKTPIAFKEEKEEEEEKEKKRKNDLFKLWNISYS